MRSLRPLALLFVSALLLSGPAETAELGRLAKKEKIVRGSLREEPFKDLHEKDPVQDSLNVETGKQSGAKFTIGRRQGGLAMGPESRFQFLGSRFDADGFRIDKLDLGIQWGIFRFNFAPPPRDVKTVLGTAPGVVRIETPAGPIELYGTDVYVQVEGKEGESGATTVYVAEGAVAVTGGGETVRVEAGHWTYVLPGRPPLNPRPLDPGLRPDGGRPPDEWQLSGPLWIDLFRRLDVPQ